MRRICLNAVFACAAVSCMGLMNHFHTLMLIEGNKGFSLPTFATALVSVLALAALGDERG